MFNEYRSAAETIQVLRSSQPPADGAVLLYRHPDDDPNGPVDELDDRFEPWQGDNWDVWRIAVTEELMHDINSQEDHLVYMIIPAHL